MVRRAIRPIILISLCTVALGGCGDGEGEASGSLDNALGYLPADAPLVIAFDTDSDGDQVKAIQAIAQRFPFSDQLTQGLEDSLARGDLDFEKDVKPLLGNEFVVGGPDVNSLVDPGRDGQY